MNGLTMIRKLSKLVMSVSYVAGVMNGVFAFGVNQTLPKNNGKQRVVVMTDGEKDDRSSMIRLLLYACDVDLEAIIQTNSVHQLHGHSDKRWLEAQLDAYEQVYANLVVHRSDYPTASEIRSKCFVGDEDIVHLGELRTSKAQQPGAPAEFVPDDWADTPGSEKIVEVLLHEDPRQVFILGWGGGNTLSRALYKLKTAFAERYEEAVAKAVFFSVSYQDDAGNYIEQHHPGVTIIHCTSYTGTWNYHVQTATADFVAREVVNGHGPLGALYPQKYISEGDTPAMLYVLDNGLRSYIDPAWGGWGGRYERIPSLANTYKVAVDEGDNGDQRFATRRWIDYANRGFEARLDWCVAAAYAAANHEPIIEVSGGELRKVKAGTTVQLDATRSVDPDGDALTVKWWHYRDPGTYPGHIAIRHAGSMQASFDVPAVKSPCSIHIILELADKGRPSLTAFKRIVFDVEP